MSRRIQLPEPVTAAARDLRGNVKSERWARIVKKAQKQAEVVRRVREKCSTEGLSLFQGLRAVSPKTSWPTFQYWSKRVGEDLEVSWEALLDHRAPPKQKPVPEVVRASAELMRRIRPDIGYQEAHGHLVAQHGADGNISDASLCRIWQAAGLIKEKQPVEKDVEEFHGGAGLALIGAAALETGASVSLANAILAESQKTIDRQPERQLPPEPAGRGEGGRLTAAYNQSTRAEVPTGKLDARWEPDYQKRQQRDLESLRVVQEKPHTLAQKALAIGAMPLITERRGMDGLDGPQGEWLKLLSGGVAYKPRTLDKFLAQLGFLDVEDGLWAAHAALSIRHVTQWAAAAGGPPWLSIVMYIDASQDPYWTRKYAKSGKISRTGRVGPCLSRIAVNAGPGIPFLMETYAGSTSLKTELPRLLERTKELVGEDGLRRLVVIDAEMSTTSLLAGLLATPETQFVTVLKGRSFETFQETSEWQSYRERDQIREGTLVILGKGAPKEGLKIRVVEMRRAGRHTQSTYFATSYSLENMSTSNVVDAYLSRWPNQEHMFRNTRNGLGLNRSHGFGGEWVKNVSIGTRKEEAQGRLQRAQQRQVEAQQTVDIAQERMTETSGSDRESHSQLLKAAQSQLSAADKKVRETKKICDSLGTTSPVIWERDPARENVATALTLNVLLLIEVVLRDYFGGVQMELRTFIEHFVNLPVTVITTDEEITYRVQGNPRNEKRTQQMRTACEEVTRRRLTRGKRRLVFVVVDPERRPVKP